MGKTDIEPVKCKLDDDECVSLSDILVSFNGPISEEHAWALCYQCAKCFKNAYAKNREKCRLVKKLDQVILHKDGYVHSKSIVCEDRLQESNSDGECEVKCIVCQLSNLLHRRIVCVRLRLGGCLATC